MSLPYNPKNKKSIVDYGKKLKDITLREACGDSILKHTFSGKGVFGQILEEYYFKYKANNKAEADFPYVEMDLKSSPLKINRDNHFLAKERLVLNKINFGNIVQQDFYSSDLVKKASCILLVFYLHDADLLPFDYVIKIVDEWNLPSADIEVIKKDYETIRKKVLEGKAHEISEGDTFYLGACTKGASSSVLSKQPFNEIPAKPRAFAFKQGYVNHIVATLTNDYSQSFGKLIPSLKVAKESSIEDLVLSKFKNYYGKTIDEIERVLNITLNRKAKSFYSNLTKAILGIEMNKEIEEFKKADVIIKTVRLKENNLPKEDLSFPNFKFNELASEIWDESGLKDILEQKYLFVFYQYSGGKLILRVAKFWNMPYSHLIEAERVWQKTKEVVQGGSIVRAVKNGLRYTNFPNKKFSKIAHVRPHAANSKDVFPLPKADILTGLTEYTKHCFWLNNTYVRDVIYLEKAL